MSCLLLAAQLTGKVESGRGMMGQDRASAWKDIDLHQLDMVIDTNQLQSLNQWIAYLKEYVRCAKLATTRCVGLITPSP